MGEQSAGKDEQVERIGSGGSRSSTWIIGGLVLAGGIAAAVFLRGNGSQDGGDAALVSLRASMASVCKDEQFAGPVPVALAKQYQESSRMQGVVAELNGIFKRGQVDCPHITKTLKSVDYPLY